jgi:hypothetical protein
MQVGTQSGKRATHVLEEVTEGLRRGIRLILLYRLIYTRLEYLKNRANIIR